MAKSLFPRQLKAIRKRLGLSRYRLAKVTGLTNQTLQNLETVTADPSWSTVQKLVAALGVAYGELADPAIEAAVKAAPPPGVFGRRKKTAATEAE
jgi:transcriptional regulator with XRE-family HTH domain